MKFFFARYARSDFEWFLHRKRGPKFFFARLRLHVRLAVLKLPNYLIFLQVAERGLISTLRPARRSAQSPHTRLPTYTVYGFTRYGPYQSMSPLSRGDPRSPSLRLTRDGLSADCTVICTLMQIECGYVWRLRTGGDSDWGNRAENSTTQHDAMRSDGSGEIVPCAVCNSL